MVEKPKNLGIIHNHGTRSFVQINYINHKLHLLDQQYAESGEQLPEEVFENFYVKAVAFAMLHPDWPVSYVRYDFEEWRKNV